MVVDFRNIFVNVFIYSGSAINEFTVRGSFRENILVILESESVPRYICQGTVLLFEVLPYVD